MWKIFLFSMAVLLMIGCKKSRDFEVIVFSPDRQPIAGATIGGGLDWDYFSVQTNIYGVAILPSYAHGYRATIYKNNFFPNIVQSLSSTKYILEPTPKQFRLIGDVKGRSIRFNSDTLITIEYGGGYHVYSYNDQGVIEIASGQLPICIKETQLRGDTLWFSTHDDGIYVYSLKDPINPKQLFHLDIPGYLGPFAVRDTIVVTGNPWSKDFLHIYSYKPDGQYKEISKLGNYLVINMVFMSHYIVILNYYENLPAVFDLQNPVDPRLVYNSAEPEYWFGFLFKNYLILTPRFVWDTMIETTNYKLIDLYNPANPLNAGMFSADSRLDRIINDSLAIGTYYSYSGAISVLAGSITNGFQTIAITNGFEGCEPPYFIIGGCLWKLQNQ